MALFNDPPELPIGLPELPDSQFAGAGIQASKQIFINSGNVYMASIAVDDTFGGNASFPIVAKRASLNVWSKPDQTRWQQIIDDWGYQFALGACQAESGGRIHFVGGVGGGIGYLIYFNYDMATDTYDFVDGLGPGTANPYWQVGNTSSNPALNPKLAALSDGRLICVWRKLFTLAGSQFTFIDSSGNFAAAQDFKTLASGTISILSLFVDSTDTTHVFYQKTDVTRNLFHATIDSSGTVGSETSLESGYSGLYEFGPGVLYGGKVTFVGLKSFDANIYLWESDPSVISWTKKTVATRTNDTGGGSSPSAAVVGPSLYIMFSQENPVPYPDTTNTIQYSIYDGSTFTAKDTAWDSGNNQYPGAGISPPGDTLALYPSVEYSGGILRMLAFSEFTPSFDQAMLYLQNSELAATGYRNHFY